MTCFDVVNGDADGLCALQQLRLDQPTEAVLVTGVKRDIALLQRVPAKAADEVTVLDVSLDRNRDALGRLLEAGVRVRWIDHHYAGALPSHPLLDADIATSPDTCTSALVDARLDGRFRAWAAVGAFGDNLAPTGRRLAAQCALAENDVETLAMLGEAINYNAYGESVEDLRIAPDALFRRLQAHADPLRFAAFDPIARELADGMHRDLALAAGIEPSVAEAGAALFELPDESWARRVQGAFANRLAAASPMRAHAVLAPRRDGAWVVSIRAPFGAAPGAPIGDAGAFCRRFGGGGRTRAGGVDRVAGEERTRLVAEFVATWGNV